MMDFNNHRLRYIDDAGLVRTLVGNGWHLVADTSVPATDSPMENPNDFDFTPDGHVLIASWHDPRVLRLNDDGYLESIAGTGVVGLRGNEGDFESPLVAQFIQLEGIVVAEDGTIWISDSMANRVRMIRDDIIQTVAGTGDAAYSGDGGPGTDAALSGPTALALDVDGSLLIADQRNHVVRRLASDGTITTIAGTGSAGFSGDGGPATAAALNGPNGLAVAPDGTIYVADQLNFRVRRIAPDGTIDTVAGSGRQGRAGDGGPALEASFGGLGRVSLDGDALLVADQMNSCVRRVILP
jgi:sugar lactone lactonase YvrE